MKYGYVRVSSIDQNEDRQIIEMKKAGVRWFKACVAYYRKFCTKEKRGCVISHIPHALKGQKLLAQGIALGIMADNKAPCKGKSFMSCLEF